MRCSLSAHRREIWLFPAFPEYPAFPEIPEIPEKPEILAEDVDIISEDIPGWLVSNEGSLTVALEVELNDELRSEGMAREIINRVQNIRKESGLEITDRISITLAPNADVEKSVGCFGDYIKTQVQADELNIGANDGEAIDFDDFTLNIKVDKI